MIEKLGIGIDIASIDDFDRIPYKQKPGLYENIFLSSEIDYCLKYKEPSTHFAGKFALKEAVIKSINEKIHISKIETSYDQSKPTINLLNFDKKYKFQASISHEKNYAIAVVISELIN